MEGTIKKIFRPDGTTLDIDKNIKIDETGKIIDKNKNGYTKVPNIGKVTKVELIKNLQAWIIDAEDIPTTDSILNKDKGANAILRKLDGGLVEAQINVVQN